MSEATVFPSFLREELLEALGEVHGILSPFLTPEKGPHFGPGYRLTPIGTSAVAAAAAAARKGWLRLDPFTYGDREPELLVPAWTKEILWLVYRDLHLVHRALQGILAGPEEGDDHEMDALFILAEMTAGRFRDLSRAEEEWEAADRWARTDPETRAVEDAISDLLRDVGGKPPEED